MRLVIVQTAAALACLIAASQAAGAADPEWSAEVLIGDAYNLNSRTHIHTVQTPAAAFDGDYETRGLEGPLHYAWRVTRWEQDRGWELQFLHHKLYLRNRPQNVEALSISHGFNIVALGRAYRMDAWRFRFGLGPVIAHPEARIAGVSYGDDYELAGAAAVGSIGIALDLTARWSIAGEVAATYGYAEMHPSGEPDLRFSVRNPAIHAQVGVGYRF
jgi:opacity protein-like surface antigen